MLDKFLSDWQIVIGAIQFWLNGGNPYGPYPSYRGVMYLPGAFAYPPPALLLGTPVALLPWWLSGVLMLVLSAWGFELWARRTSHRLSLPWLILWLPLAQGLLIGQLTLIALVGLALAELTYVERRDRLAGILLALALIKPQTAILPAAYLLIDALLHRRWTMLAWFGLLSGVLWGGAALIGGVTIYAQWLDGLRNYGPNLPNRPLLFPPFGPLLALLAIILWWRYGRNDVWGLLLLLNTLIYPLSVVYVAVGIAFVVIRWRPAGPWYPLALSWLLPFVLIIARTPDGIASLTQAIVATGLLAGVCPLIPWGTLFARWRLPSH